MSGLESPWCAKVLPDDAQDKVYEYLIPDAMRGRIAPGHRVSVPLGKGQRTGYIVSVDSQSEWPRAKLRPIEADQGLLIPPTLLKLGEWMATYYCASRIQTIRTMLPAPVRADKTRPKIRRVLRLAAHDRAAHLIEELKEAPPQAAVIQALHTMRQANSVAALAKAAGTSASPIQTLIDKGHIIDEEEQLLRDPCADMAIVPSFPLELTDEQQAALDLINSKVEQGGGAILLHGVTGSGKTEVYLQAIAACLEKHRQAIVLVPEISLTPQTVQRFRARFGERVAVLHSGLSDGERFDQWQLIHQGRTDIVVGARSALFAPFLRLGLIIVDEEHEPSYKQDSMPRYQARDMAVLRGTMEKAAVVLGSATPAFETMANAISGKYALAKLTRRADPAASLPEMQVVDMKLEAALTGGPQIFSRALKEAVYQQLATNMQTILFLNRRGYATALVCPKCNHAEECPACSVRLTFHRHNDTLGCHLCGHVRVAPAVCSQCQDPEIRRSGLGTEKLQDIASKLFPGARIGRMDSDTMTRKDSHRRMLDDFQAGKLDILIGTQMIAKGLHFPRVTLVGIVFADMSLNIPDFRAAERTFQLLTQVSGRSGRGSAPGRVIVQSYDPHHPALIHAAAGGDARAFYDDEIGGRAGLHFPPFGHLAIIHLKGPQEEALQAYATALQERLAAALAAEPSTRVMAAVPSPIARMRHQYRVQISIFTRRMLSVAKIINHFLEHDRSPQGIEVSADIDAQSMS